MLGIWKEIKISSGRRRYVKIRGIASTMHCVEYCDNNIGELQELFSQHSVINILLLVITYRRTTHENTLAWHGLSLAGYRILQDTIFVYQVAPLSIGGSSSFCQDSRIVLISQAELFHNFPSCCPSDILEYTNDATIAASHARNLVFFKSRNLYFTGCSEKDERPVDGVTSTLDDCEEPCGDSARQPRYWGARKIRRIRTQMSEKSM